MYKTIPLSLIATATLFATEVELAPIGVESTIITEVAQKAQTSADVAVALQNAVPSIDMSRRSGIANDIFIRGQKRDNITVEVDGTKVCGACPNRMDPPASHIVANQIDEVEVIEGPYDVESFGTLSGGVKIKTKKPTKEFKAEVNTGFGSWSYKKFGASASGGNDTIRVAAAISTESSDQYKDGDGNTIADQIDQYIEQNPTAAGTALQPEYHDMPAYKKNSAMVKAFITTTENQELRLSYTANRSDDVLYGNSKMDALWDDSNIYNVEYNIDKITKVLTNLNFQYYHTDVDHPMDTSYRMSSYGTNPVMKNWLSTAMDGVKLKATTDVEGYKFTFGVDGSVRNWDGHYEKNDVLIGIKSIDDTDTINMALFAKLEKSYGVFSFVSGARVDETSITNATFEQNSYHSVGINMMGTYMLNDEHKIFLGVGQAYRVPDARELYFVNKAGVRVGSAALKNTRNQEIDFGYEVENDVLKLKAKLFYSLLRDYIYYQKGLVSNNFQNIDATIYGGEISGSYFATDDMSLDMGVSYKRGKKDKALDGQTNTNLTDMAPLRANIALNYEYANNSLATFEVRASDKWDEIDDENGEQVLDSWAILNAKVKHAINKKFDITLGVNNILDKTYALSNTGADLILVSAGGSSDVMLLNEPGRYIYTNLDFKF